jgi:hypothetical protein
METCVFLYSILTCFLFVWINVMPVIAVACVELDGSDQRPGIFIIGATNRYDNISLLSSPLLSSPLLSLKLVFLVAGLR